MKPKIKLHEPKALEAALAAVKAARKKTGKAVAVFDLDDTILSTNSRHLRIITEFSSDPAVPRAHREAASRLKRLKPHELRYNVIDTARAAGLEDESVLGHLHDYWYRRFFENEYLSADEPTAGAVEYCHEAAAAGAAVVYLTAREEFMREGTEMALERLGFPQPGRNGARLILKMRLDLSDLEFKGWALEGIAGLGEIACAFENEPAHINFFHEAMPRAVNIFVDTKHSGRPIVPHPEIPWISNFCR